MILILQDLLVYNSTNISQLTVLVTKQIYSDNVHAAWFSMKLLKSSVSLLAWVLWWGWKIITSIVAKESHWLIQIFKCANHKFTNAKIFLVFQTEDMELKSAFHWLACSLEVYMQLHKYQVKNSRGFEDPKICTKFCICVLHAFYSNCFEFISQGNYRMIMIYFQIQVLLNSLINL